MQKETEETKKIKSVSAEREEKILEFWRANNIFKKTLDKESKGEFVFYEGPPTANAKPALHHLEARAFKDVIPRYKTMQGFHVRRKAGWDTHGLPVELQIEKKLGMNSKKDIEKYGIDKFNKECKDSVHEYIGLWKTFTERMGYWVDFDDAYYTYDAKYIESLWNIVGKVNDKGLLYKDYKVIPWCARCGTGLSSHELAQEYQDDKDISITAKFKIIGFPDAYFLAWTTTPWTLPGNVGLAVGADIVYVEIKVTNGNKNEILVLAKERLETIGEPYEIIAEHKGSEMAGMSYEPLYPYMQELNTGDDKMANAYKVYVADFVTTTDGTGIVHTAVMYGAEDFVLGTKVGLPKFHTVNEEGHFIKGTDFLEGRYVKEKDENGKPTLDVDIINDLTKKGLFYKKETYTHSYPHCWRCKNPLIYYARDSWYIGMEKLQSELVAENEKINWEPSHIKEGRFGEWIRGAKDWAISRERYWGTPLPVWVAEDGERLFVDSFDTLKKYTKKSGNKYFVMRHGGTEGNEKEIVSYKSQATDNLTEIGEQQVHSEIGNFKDKKIDIIICSPFTRTRETAKIVCSELGLDESNVVFDDKLREVDPGDFDGKTWTEYHKYIYDTGPGWFDRVIPNGEALKDVKKRTAEVLYELEEKYKGKNILIITHGGPAWLLFVNSGMYEPDGHEYQIANEHVFIKEFKRFKNAEIRELPFVPMPHNENYELDPHRPFIDEVVLEKNGKEFRRVKEVMDVWFDSGSMPFAQDHYPFQNKEWVEGAGYPADFISEAIDQTRGWFYTLLAVGVLTGMGTPYKNVICLGHLLDKDGKKMSKSIGNIVEPFEQMDKFGVDAVRFWMYSVNQPGESKNYDEKTVADINNKVFNLYYNVLSFYELYRDVSLEASSQELEDSSNVLDIWIIARLNQLVNDVTKDMDAFDVFRPTRAIRDFMDDLSTWYLRRSRDRIKDGDVDAKRTLYTVLKTLSKILAPFAPFTAEDVWQKLKNDGDVESVHLAEWPECAPSPYQGEGRGEVLQEMKKVREICALGNAERQKHNIPVRQPLKSILVNDENLRVENIDYIEIIKEELNIKNVLFGNPLIEGTLNKVTVDKEITPELKKEGDYRELVRAVQDMRKKMELTPSDRISITISKEGDVLVSPFMDEFKKTVQADNVTFAGNDGIEIKIDDKVFNINIEK